MIATYSLGVKLSAALNYKPRANKPAPIPDCITHPHGMTAQAISIANKSLDTSKNHARNTTNQPIKYPTGPDHNKISPRDIYISKDYYHGIIAQAIKIVNTT